MTDASVRVEIPAVVGPGTGLSKSQALFERTSKVLAGGVGSADRAQVRPHPIFIDRGQGSRMWDVDGNEYIDYLLGYGPLILGHAHPRLTEAITRQAARGTMYGAAHRLEAETAELLSSHVPSMEVVRFGQSGTEVVQSALRLARAATGRQLIVKFEGQYHGWGDHVAVSYVPPEDLAGPASHPSSVPSSQGQAPGTYEDMLIAGWNDLAALTVLFEEHRDEIAAVITEPIMCNCGVIEPLPGFLEGIRDLCDRFGSLLIFDEVQTGFRVALAGAQGILGVTPDLTCMGKALSGGLPVAAIGGRRDLMELIGDRRVFQAGTYNSNPLCLAAIPVVVSTLAEEGRYAQMASLSSRLRLGIAETITPLGGYVQGTSTMFGIGIGPGPVTTMRDSWRNDGEAILRLKEVLWSLGIYTKPTPRDIWYVSTEHTEDDIDVTLRQVEEAVGILAHKSGTLRSAL